MSSLATYGYCMLVSAAFVALLAMSTDFFVSYVNDILIPCQHDTPWLQSEGRCMCENTGGVFAGKYCDECQCEHLGICGVIQTRNSSSSRWGCRCPSHQKWVGTLCDNCYAVEHTEESCRGECKEDYFGPKCNTLCLPNVPSTFGACQEITAGGGTCNACNGNGKCTDRGECECDEGYFTSLGGEQCSLTCDNCNLETGSCLSIGGKLQCICKPNYFGSDCSETCLAPGSSIPCSGHGSCEMDLLENLQCVCEPHFTGEYCEIPCPGDNSYPSACSGHGICSAKEIDGELKGVCDCVGVWESDDCSCSELFTCSGHGACNADGSCACYDEGPFGPTIAIEEMHFSGSACESCKDAWFGQTCHLFCNSTRVYNPDPDKEQEMDTIGLNIGCNGHGTCKLVTTGDIEHITCACENTDPDAFCGKCMPNYFPDISLPSMSIPPCSVECNPQTCSYNGECNENYNGDNNLCICKTWENEAGQKLDTLDPDQFCSTCKPNWFPSDLTAPNRCSSYCAADGQLDQNNYIYFGEGIFGQNFDLNGDVNAQNICRMNKVMVGTTEEVRFLPDPDCRVCSSSTFSENICMADGTCKCDGGTTGEYCEIDCGVEEDGTVCSGHGRCIRNALDTWFNPDTRKYRCECMPYDTYTSETRQRLLKRGFRVESPPTPEHYGQYCEFHCPHYNEELCSGRGSCKTGVAVSRQPIKVNNRTFNAGEVVSCVNDTNCEQIPGGFCARLSTPWDSLTNSSRSFFSNSVDSPGYSSCATSTECIESIYSVEWDDFCVNMLNGWYPNTLNTAQCVYKNDECRNQVEDFFMNNYEGTDTWCKAALKVLSPDKLDNNKCGSDASSSSNADIFENQTQPLCHTYTLESACNAQSECIYDQTFRYIQETDRFCQHENRMKKDQSGTDTCSGKCAPTGDGACSTKTYCRAKTCQDILFENNVESLCFDISEPCVASEKDFSWQNFCSEASGNIRKAAIRDKTRLNSMETFYSCYMFDNSRSPVLPETDIPGGRNISGQIEVFSEKILVSEFRQSFVTSRAPTTEAECSKLDFSNFCEKHIPSVAPSWYENVEPVDSWFMNYLLVCDGLPIEVFNRENEANQLKSKLESMGRYCAVEYRTSGVDASSGFEDSSEEEDSIAYRGLPFTIKCLNPVLISETSSNVLQKDTETVDFRKDWSIFPNECEVIENILHQRWGGTPWKPYFVQDKFKTSCQSGNEAIWIPKQVPKPTLSDMELCAARDKVVDCPECDESQVKCRTEIQFKCIARNPCRANAQCLKNVNDERDNDRISREYYCDITPFEPIADITVENEQYSAVAGLNNLIFFERSTVIPSKGEFKANGNTYTYFQRGSPRTGQIALRVSDETFKKLRGPGIPKESPYISSLKNCDDDINWFKHCDNYKNKLGAPLLSEPPFGLTQRQDHALWSGKANLLKEKHLAIFRVGVVHFKSDVMFDSLSVRYADSGMGGTWLKSTTIYKNGTTIEDYHNNDFTIDEEFSRCVLEALHEPVVVKSVEIKPTDGESKESIASFKDVLMKETSRLFYFADDFQIDAGRSDFNEWSFDINGYLSNKRRNGTNLNDMAEPRSSDGSSSAEIPLIKGVRWPLDSFDTTELRLSGWTKIMETDDETANMQLLSADYKSLVTLSVYQTSSLLDESTQKRVLVNGEPTNCQVQPFKWWFWEIETSEHNEKHRIKDSKTVIDHIFDVTVKVNGVTCQVIEKVVVESEVLEREHHGRIAEHFRDISLKSLHQCRESCHADQQCKQWSHTEHDSHCYLYSKRCHEDVSCTHGTHILRSFVPKKLGFFEIWSEATQVRTSWTRLRAEPIIPEPFEISGSVCKDIDYSRVDSRWAELFNETYVPWEPDSTAICNGLNNNWKLLLGIGSGVCGGHELHDSVQTRDLTVTRGSKKSCTIPRYNLDQCSEQIEFAQPEISEEDCTPLLGLNWTAYCHYKQSFNEDIDGNIPFLPNVKGPMSDLCIESLDVRDDLSSKTDGICKDTKVPADWYLNCFERTAVYEDFCSAECIGQIEDMISYNGKDDPGLCEKRKKFLDLTKMGDGTASNIPQECQCNIDQVVITDFCLVQDLYHDGDRIKIPELYNSDCISAENCLDVLSESMDRPTWRKWCFDLADGDIPGVCSETVCDCDTEEYRGVSGELCELTCPTGISNGMELPCSGRNGQCFARESISKDNEMQTLANSFRDNSWAGPFIPEWMKGPKPNVAGRCQCALGSGLSCSIPCDNCNDGFYGPYMASQYGICDSFNGICRALPMFMRYNSEKIVDGNYVSKDTTAFESSGQGLSKWKYPDRFLYESDETIFEAAKNYTLDNDDVLSGIEYVSDTPLENRLNIQTIIKVWDKLCAPPNNMSGIVNTRTNIPIDTFSYLKNSDKISYMGVEYDFKDNETANFFLSQTTEPSHNSCRRIDISEDWFLCFVGGELVAYDTSGNVDQRLIVFQEGDGPVAQTNMSFAVSDLETVYAYGGTRIYPTMKETFDVLYKISIRRQKWDPADIVFITWTKLTVAGDNPPKSNNMPMVAYLNSLFLIQPEGMYKMVFETPKQPAFWIKYPLPTNIFVGEEELVPTAMVGNEQKQLFIKYSNGEHVEFLSEEKDDSLWKYGRTMDNEIPTFEIYSAGLAQTFSCELSITKHSIAVGNITIANYQKNPQNVSIYLREWSILDIDSDHAIERRVLNSILWRYHQSNAMDRPLTEFEKYASVNLLERVYMQQARWSISSMVQTKMQLSPKFEEPLIKSLAPVIDPNEDFIRKFRDISSSFFAQTPRTSPNKFGIYIEGPIGERTVVISANYKEELKSYEQDIEFENDIITVICSWSPTEIRLELKEKYGLNSIMWSSPQSFRTWYLLIHLEEWQLSGSEPTIFKARTAPRMGIFHLYGMERNEDTYSMRHSTSTFLQYSASHCSLTSDQTCPGTLPYINLPCSGHGRCDISCQCTCEVAKSVLESDPNALNVLDPFKSPWRGAGCEITCPGYDGYNLESICSGRPEACQPDGTCACDQTQTGDACQFDCPKNEEGEICSLHGGCGTKAYELSSFEFKNEAYIDRLSAMNRKQYSNALEEFYNRCFEQNYVQQPAQFGTFVENDYPSFFTIKEAFERCNYINKHLQLDITQEELRKYPIGKCLGIRLRNVSLPLANYPSEQKYFPVTLLKPLTYSPVIQTVPIFDCEPEECSIKSAESDEKTVRGLRTTLVSPSFEFHADYIHGYSSGRRKFIVNDFEIFFDIIWTPRNVKITLGSDVYGKDVIVDETGAYDSFKFVIEEQKLVITKYPSLSPVSSSTDIIWLSPTYDTKYRKIIEPMPGNYFLIPSQDTGNPRILLDMQAAEYDCDQESNCVGIIQWDKIVDKERKYESLYSLYTNKLQLGDDWELYSMENVQEKFTFFKKMSFVYQGSEQDNSACFIVQPGLSRYPRVNYTEKYDIPIQDIDLRLAEDEETGSVLVGDGYWSKCWTYYKDIHDKTACHNEAIAQSVFGFAFSDEQGGTCLVYTGITDNTKIKLNMYNSESRLSLFDPCDEDASWFT